MKQFYTYIFISFLLSFLTVKTVKAQFKIPKIPKEQTSIYDYVGLLSSSEKKALEHKLVRYSDSTSTQIVIAIVGTVKGESIGILTTRWAHQWKIGQAKEDNGVFILLAKDDKKIWIAPGYGVEQYLSAGVTGELVRNVIIPEFKKGFYYLGLDKGTTAVFEILNGTYKGTRKEPSQDFDLSFLIFVIIMIIFFIIVFRGNKGGTGGGGGGNYKDTDYRNILDTIILTSAGRGGFGTGSFSGRSSSGGFGGGFGGGGFSGGGAGGSW